VYKEERGARHATLPELTPCPYDQGGNSLKWTKGETVQDIVHLGGFRIELAEAKKEKRNDYDKRKT